MDYWQCPLPPGSRWSLDRLVYLAFLDDTQPAGLIEVLLDKHAPFGDRHDAAMDLEEYDEDAAASALGVVINDSTEDALLIEEAEQSLMQIRARVEAK